MKKYQNFINGKWVDAKSGQVFDNKNPANWTEVIGTFPKSAREDVEDAVKAARKAFDSWRLMPAPSRGDILKRVGDLMVARKEEIGRGPLGAVYRAEDTNDGRSVALRILPAAALRGEGVQAGLVADLKAAMADSLVHDPRYGLRPGFDPFVVFERR